MEPLRLPQDEEFFREFLNSFHRKRSSFGEKDINKTEEVEEKFVPSHFKFRAINVIVDVAGEFRFRSFLKALEESVLVKRRYNYVFANFDMEDSLLSAFHYSLINVTGFQLFHRNSKAFVNSRKLFEGLYHGPFPSTEHIPVSGAFAHDALLVAGAAFEQTLRDVDDQLFTQSFSQHQLYNKGISTKELRAQVYPESTATPKRTRKIRDGKLNLSNSANS